jgi:membrane-associated phospholipid phosphatase
LAHLSLAGALGASLGVLALADEPHAWVEDLGLALESTLAAGLLTQSVKIAAARPYPFMYGGGVTPSQAAKGVNYASFWSGHTAVGMATATSAARLVDARGAPLWLRVAAWSVGPLLALGAGAFMASAGNHFPTDVALGAVAGAAVGVSNVALHAQ